MDIKNNIAKIYSLLSVVLVGAIGSEVWDIFLKELIYNLGGLLVKIATSFYKGYFDRLYENVGSQTDILLYIPSVFILGAIIFLPIFFYLKLSTILRRAAKATDENQKIVKQELSKAQRFILTQAWEHSARFKIILIIPLIFCSIIYTDILIVSVVNNSAVKSVQRRLDIIRPYATEGGYYQLVSNFRMVKSRDSLQKLISDIDTIAIKQNIHLPELKLYGVISLST